MALVRVETENYSNFCKYFRNCLLCLIFMSGILISIGCGINYLNHKYIRIMTNTTGICEKEVLNIDVTNTKMCCENEYRKSDWVCVASYDQVERYMTSSMAFVLPFLPLILTSANDVISNRFFTTIETTPKIHVIQSFLFRTTIVAAIILFRMVITCHFLKYLLIMILNSTI